MHPHTPLSACFSERFRVREASCLTYRPLFFGNDVLEVFIIPGTYTYNMIQPQQESTGVYVRIIRACRIL